MALTPGGLPYPLGTDKVVDGDDAIKALATALDLRIPIGGPPATALFPFNAALPAIVNARIQTAIGQATTNSAGVIGVTFPKPFTTAVLFAIGVTVGGAAFAPVINSSQITLTGMSLYWQNTPNTSLTFAFLAIGY